MLVEMCTTVTYVHINLTSVHEKKYSVSIRKLLGGGGGGGKKKSLERGGGGGGEAFLLKKKDNSISQTP